MGDNRMPDKAYWLKMQRKKKGLTQKELARLAGTSLRSIQSYEQGTRTLSGASVELVQTLCRVLDCSEQDILSYPGSRTGGFGACSDEELCRLYGENRAGDTGNALQGGLSARELGQLSEEMALRFYRQNTPK